MTKKHVLKLVAALLILINSLQAWAWNESSDLDIRRALDLKPNIYSGIRIFRVCAACHYQEGWGQRNGVFPQIAGQHPKVLIKQLIDSRERDRATPGMDHFVMLKIINDPQALADVAGYISDIPMTPNPGIGPGTNLQHGQALYMKYCANCHGDNGEGDNSRFSPRIQGQHYEYLLRQFKWIYSNDRKNAHPGMQRVIADFTQADAEAVIDLISRMKPAKEDLAPSPDWKNPDFE